MFKAITLGLIVASIITIVAFNIIIEYKKRQQVSPFDTNCPI